MNGPKYGESALNVAEGPGTGVEVGSAAVVVGSAVVAHVVITADFESANSKQRWTVPLGIGVYKMQLIGGKLPIKFGIEGQYMPVRPDAYGQQYNIRVVVAPIIPAFF